jgi:hypothetical protein
LSDTAGARCRSAIRPISTMAAPLNMAMPIWVARQPYSAVVCCTSGGHTVPAM